MSGEDILGRCRVPLNEDLALEMLEAGEGIGLARMLSSWAAISRQCVSSAVLGVLIVVMVCVLEMN